MGILLFKVKPNSFEYYNIDNIYKSIYLKVLYFCFKTYVIQQLVFFRKTAYKHSKGVIAKCQ